MKNKIKLVILDIDGILTDGSKIYDKSGMPIYKKFCDKDFTAIKKLKSSNVNVCFLSGDQNINKAMAKKRNVEFFLSRTKNKLSFVKKFIERYKCSLKEMLFIGDDIFDIDLLNKVGFSVTTSDANNDVKKVCDLILKSKGGENAIMELTDYLYQNKMIRPFNYKEFIKLDLKEKF
jgi:YrbI family 3-deoxy-D-manno-octulosonate 8-phosphate phosphatase